jgi:hypothetical protein
MMKTFLLIFFAFLLLGVVGYGAYRYSQGTRSLETITPSPTPAPAAVETETPAPTAGVTQPAQTSDDNDAIEQALHKKNGWAAGSVTLQVKTDDGQYASGLVNDTGGYGGGYFFAVKDNGTWVIVADGNGVIECASLTRYPDYPKTLIPACYDRATDKQVKR